MPLRFIRALRARRFEQSVSALPAFPAPCSYDAQVLAKHSQRFGKVTLFKITEIAKDWEDAQQRFFGENGLIESVYKPKPR